MKLILVPTFSVAADFACGLQLLTLTAAAFFACGSARAQIPGSSGEFLYNNAGVMGATSGITTPDGLNLVATSYGTGSNGWQIFSSTGAANQTLLQATVTSGAPAGLTILPSGSATEATFVLDNSSDATLANRGELELDISGSTALLQTKTHGTGTPVTTQLFGEASVGGGHLTAINWQFNGVTQASISNTGLFAASGATFTGNVGIGMTNPQHLLQVAGTIGAEEVIVSSTGADYVFEPDYRLAPLSEVSDYIKTNHHLPEIPSASEVQAKGLSLGEMQAKLLAKIEELTLHAIQTDKRMSRLEQENRELRERIRTPAQ